MANDIQTVTAIQVELDARFGPTRADAFRRDLQRLLNCYSVDAALNTADWVLADLLIDQLKVYAKAMRVSRVNVPQNWSTR